MALCWTLLMVAAMTGGARGQRGVPPVGSEYNDVRVDGSYQFGFQTGDRGQHYQAAVANPQNQVAGRFGSYDPAKKVVVNTEYTAGRRGFRARGPNIARKMDLSQAKIPYNPPVSPSSPNYNPTYSGYHDPNEDPSYSFDYRAPTHAKQEVADSTGRVNGQYFYYDDVGERHDVNYEAGANTGFIVKTPFPDSKVFGGLFYKGADGKPGGNPRGKTSIVQKLDGSYRFVAAGPDQRRTEQSDAVGNVRGSYTYVDDKGQQRTVEYIAGPGIGYRIIKKGTGISFPAIPPFIPPLTPPSLIPPFPTSSSTPFSEGLIDDFSTTLSPGDFGFGDNRPTSGGSGGPIGIGRPGDGGSNQDIHRPAGGTGTGTGTGGTGTGGDGAGDNRPPSWTSTESSAGGGSWSSTTPGGGSWTTPSPPSQTGNWGAGTTKPPGSPSSFKPPTSFGGDGNGYPPGPPPLYNTPKPPPTSGYQPSDSTFSTPSTGGGSSTTEGYPGYPESEGYPSGRPKPGSPPFTLPDKCCTPGSPPPLDNPPSAFPEDDPNRPSKKPPKPSEPDDFLQAPFEDFPPKEFNGPNYYRPLHGSAPTTGVQVGDSTFLSSNKNYFSFPAGVAVRAHIQSLDILPFGSRIPAPGAALEAGISNNSRR